MRAQLISELNAAVGQLDIGDLPLLASLHEHFQQIKHDAESAPASASTESMGACAARGKELLERIILQETTDTNAAVASLVETVKSMQALIDGAGASSPATPATPATPAPEKAEVPKESHALEEAPLGTTPDDLSLIGEFVTESREHLDAAEAQLLRLEDQPEDLEAINAVFRSFHTIKGVAGFLNLKQIGALAHASENLLDKARKQEIRLSHDHIDLILRALDLMKRLIGDVESASRAGAALAIRAELPDLIGQVDRAASGEFTPSSAPRLAPPLAAGDGSQATRLNEEAPSEKTTEKSPETSAQSNHQQETVKVATDRLDSLINMVGELVIAQAMVSQDVGSVANSNPRMARNMSHLGKISRELQEIAMSMRMVPIQGVFQKMTRLARDLGRKFGKELEFVTVGGETELDRNVVEAIGDPLVHMVRNAIDHGIEPPDVRRSAGKSPVGRVQLRAFHQAGAVVIELKDDGKGLRRDKILKKAIENGLVREGQELSDSEVFKLIFAAGLSTAEKVTDVSGRGVGMDVVRKNVENLRGRIDITSEEGKGSVFTIRLPLTLAVIDGLTVRVGTERMIIPITSIEQNLRPRAEQIATVHGRGEVCVVRGATLPLFRLHRLFNIPTECTDPTQGVAVIVHDDSRRCCLLVDELVGQQNVVIKSLGPGVGQIKGVSGGAILGDGTVSLILDVPGLIDSAMNG